jgi:hypothetical protein
LSQNSMIGPDQKSNDKIALTNGNNFDRPNQKLTRNKPDLEEEEPVLF